LTVPMTLPDVSMTVLPTMSSFLKDFTSRAILEAPIKNQPNRFGNRGLGDARTALNPFNIKQLVVGKPR
jgi:hypothetical protein